MRLLMPMTALAVTITCLHGAAGAQTQSAVEDNVPGRADVNRHRLTVSGKGGLMAASCRTTDPATVGVALLFDDERRRPGAQRITVTRDGERREVVFVPIDESVTLSGKQATDLLTWALTGRSALFEDGGRLKIAFELAEAQGDVARFRQLCRF